MDEIVKEYYNGLTMKTGAGCWILDARYQAPSTKYQAPSIKYNEEHIIN